MKQNPGKIAGLQLNDFGTNEIQILNNLASVWFVTYTNAIVVGKQHKYPYAFLKATDIFREKFSFFANILAIIHPYPVLDGRIIDAIEKITEKHPNRIDRLCVLVISSANSVDKEVLKINTSSEARILVPFKYQELLGGTQGKEDLIARRLEQNLYTKDLFAISSALQTDRYFYGRKDDIHFLIGKHQSGENSGIFGLRRIGKTSVLWAVVRELKASKNPVAFIDCSDTKYHKSRWNQTLYQIKEALYTSNNIDKSQGNQKHQYTESDASSSFTEDLKLLKGRSNNKPVLIILDEVESLCFDIASTNHWKTGGDYLSFWQTLRSIYQQNPGLFTFCICGVNPRALETAIIPEQGDNPLYRYVEAKYLDFFLLDDVKSMLEGIGSYMGITFDEEVYTYFTDDFGGHPFLIRQAASKLFKIFSRQELPRKIHIKKQTYKDKYAELTDSLHDYISLILKVLKDRYNDEYLLLQYLAAGQHETFANFAKEDRSWVEHLIGYGLIVEEHGKYHFRINVVQRAIEEEAKHLKSPNNNEERWELLSESRNALETELRTLTKQLLKISLGEEKAKLAIIEAMNKRNQKEKACNLPYDRIFKEELYFSDLKRAIENNWNIFINIFEENSDHFSHCMQTANTARADAHAKDIGSEEFQSAMKSINWLDNCLRANT